MFVDEVLLGRPQVHAREITLVQTDPGRVARWLLGATVLVVTVFEAATLDPVLAFGTYLYAGIGTWTGTEIPFSALELILAAAVLASAVTAAAHAPPLRPTALRLAIALFAVGLLVGLARGLIGGGDGYVAMWEIRFLLYAPACFFVVRTAIRTREHVLLLMRIALVGAVAFAVEGAWRKIALINSGSLGTVPEFYFAHEDVLFLASALVVFVSAYLYRASTGMRIASALASPILLYTLLGSGRRSGVIVLLVGLLLLGLTVVVLRPKVFLASVVPVLALVALYVALFWDASGLVGQPARAIRSLYEPDARDAASNLYRLIETFNINVTIHDDPVFGVGFGRPFNMAAALPDLSWWPFWRYETHNSVLWIWLKTGIAGYLAFWALIGGAIARAALAARRLRDPGLRAAAIWCLVAVVGVVVFAYVDLGFVSGRVTVFLGVVLGLTSVVAALGQSAQVAAEGRT